MYMVPPSAYDCGMLPLHTSTIRLINVPSILVLHYCLGSLQRSLLAAAITSSSGHAENNRAKRSMLLADCTEYTHTPIFLLLVIQTPIHALAGVGLHVQHCQRLGQLPVWHTSRRRALIHYRLWVRPCMALWTRGAIQAGPVVCQGIHSGLSNVVLQSVASRRLHSDRCSDRCRPLTRYYQAVRNKRWVSQSAMTAEFKSGQHIPRPPADWNIDRAYLK